MKKNAKGAASALMFALLRFSNFRMRNPFRLMLMNALAAKAVSRFANPAPLL